MIIDYNEKGKNKVYFLKKNMLALKFVINAENYKYIKTVEKYPQLLSVFQDLSTKSEDCMVILFGSYAKGIPRQDSDIDIYINTEKTGLKKKLKQINDSLSIKTGRFSTDDLLIQEIIKNHVIIKGAEEYYEKIKFLK